MSDNSSSEKPFKTKGSLLDQLSPDYGYDENGMWNGKTRKEVEAFIAEQKRRIAQQRLSEARLKMLAQWEPTSPSN
jgi:hypothetical protein